MKHDMIKMPRKDFMAEHARLVKVLEGAKTAAAAKELARQRKEVAIAMKKHGKMHNHMMKTPAMYKGEEY